MHDSNGVPMMKILILLGLLTSPSFGCSIPEALELIRPKAVWTLYGEKYDGLVWQDKNQSKPTLEEVNLGIAQCEAKKTQEDADHETAVSTFNDSSKSEKERLDALAVILGL
jgi:hypothetical protein